MDSTCERYRFIEDPGHGWLEVPISELKILDIQDQISDCSYMKGDKAYLEEDCDMAIFVEAYEKKFKAEVNIAQVYQEHTPIRGYLRYVYGSGL